jgi:ABC-type antimicrobial peptide transport system permease subunit
VLGTPLIEGRDFSASDDEAAPAAAIVNAAFVRKYLAGVPALGQHVKVSVVAREMAIIGVAKDAVYETLRAPAPPTVYSSYLQSRGQPMTLIVNGQAPLATVAAAIRASIQPRTPAKPIRVRTLAAQVEDSLISERLMTILTSVFGVLALGLAAVGLYGLMSYSVVTRTREIGVRLALGARPTRVLRMVLANALRKVLLGVVIGLPLAWMASRLVANLVFGLEPTDGPTIATAVAILVTVGLASAAAPARRAAMVDPATSIHVE